MVSEIAFLSSLGVLLPTAVVLSLIFAKLRLPTVLAQIFTGMSLGPNGLGLVTELETLNLLAVLGIVFLMFFVGLELDPSELRRLGFKIIILSLIQMLVTFVIGLALALAVGFSWVTAVFVGSIMAITSTAIAAKLLLERGRLHQETGHVIMGLSVVEDFIAILLILVLPDVALIGKIELNRILGLLFRGILLFVLIIAFGLMIAPRMINFISQFEVEFSEITILSALALGIFFSYVSTQLGFSPAIGAFLTGLMIRGKQSKFLTSKILPIKDLFIVLFFVSMGTLIQVGSLLTELVAVVILGTGALFGKMIGGWLITRLGKLKASGTEVGLILSPRGEFSLVLAKEGARTGAVSTALFSVTGALTIFTVLMSALGLRIIAARAAEEEYKLHGRKDA